VNQGAQKQHQQQKSLAESPLVREISMLVAQELMKKGLDGVNLKEIVRQQI
jgi:hypothetical protein